jgi:hypothetical protein
MSGITIASEHYSKLWADTQRLDHLQSIVDTGHAVLVTGTFHATEWVGQRWAVEVFTEAPSRSAPTLRDAIDASNPSLAKSPPTAQRLLDQSLTNTDIRCPRCECFRHVAITEREGEYAKLLCATCGQVFGTIRPRNW